MLHLECGVHFLYLCTLYEAHSKNFISGNKNKPLFIWSLLLFSLFSRDITAGFTLFYIRKE